MTSARAVVALAGGLLVAASVRAADIRKANELLDNWQLEDALAVAQEALASDPENPAALFLAARVLHARGQHVQALPLLRDAIQRGYDTEGLEHLVQSSAAYAAHFSYRDTPHFRIAYLNKDEIVADYAENVLEAAYTHIGKALGFLPAERGEKIVVEIYPDARGLAGATGLTVKEIQTSGTIAVCKFHRLMITSPLATAGGYSWADTIAHELTHLIISKKSRNSIPIWLHEGIAKYYESLWKGPAGEALSPASEKLLAKAVRDKKLITFAQMHPSMAKLPSQDDAALAFAEVFTVIEFFRERYGAQSVPRVLELTGTGVPLESALKKVFGLGLSGIETTWRRYLAERKFRDIPGAAPRAIQLAENEDSAGKERPLEQIDDKEVHDYSRLGELLQLRGHHTAAVVEYEKAYARAGARYVTLAYRLARAYAALERTDAALQVLDKAFALYPEEADAHLLAGRIRAQRGEHDRAQAHYEAARLGNPFNPEIHQRLAEIYEKQGRPELAARERRHLELAQKPRPTRTYDLPALAAGEARLSLTTIPWGRLRINGGPPLSTPAWDVPVPAGRLTVELLRDGAAPALRELEIGAGESKTLVLQ